MRNPAKNIDYTGPANSGSLRARRPVGDNVAMKRSSGLCPAAVDSSVRAPATPLAPE